MFSKRGITAPLVALRLRAAKAGIHRDKAEAGMIWSNHIFPQPSIFGSWEGEAIMYCSILGAVEWQDQRSMIGASH